MLVARMPQALKAAAYGDYSMSNTLYFVFGVGNLVFAKAHLWQLCELGPGSKWFEIQVSAVWRAVFRFFCRELCVTIWRGRCLLAWQSGRHTSVYADWGGHFCDTQDANPTDPDRAATLDSFVAAYPFCWNSQGTTTRRLDEGFGGLDPAWTSLVRLMMHRPPLLVVSWLNRCVADWGGCTAGE